MASRLGKHLLRTKSKAENFGWYALYPCFLLICCLAAPGLIFGYCWRNSLTHLMLIIAFRWSIFGRKVTRRGSVSTSNWVPSGLWSQWHNPLTHSPQIPKILSPNLPLVSLKFRNTINALNAFKTVLAWDWSGL